MSARLDHYLRTQIPKYRVALSDLATDTGAGAKIAFELFGIANKEVKLVHLQMSKPSIAITPFQLNKYTIGSTGSTGQTIVSPVRARGTDSTYGGIVRLYQSSPDASTGTLDDQLQEIDLDTTDIMNEHYGDDRGIGLFVLESSAESFGFAITSTGANTLNGYIEFTSEP